MLRPGLACSSGMRGWSPNPFQARKRLLEGYGTFPFPRSFGRDGAESVRAFNTRGAWRRQRSMRPRRPGGVRCGWQARRPAAQRRARGKAREDRRRPRRRRRCGRPWDGRILGGCVGRVHGAPPLPGFRFPSCRAAPLPWTGQPMPGFTIRYFSGFSPPHGPTHGPQAVVDEKGGQRFRPFLDRLRLVLGEASFRDQAVSDLAYPGGQLFHQVLDG